MYPLYWISTSILITVIMMNMFLMLAHKSKMKKQKKIEFECGFNSMTKSRLPFSTQFFLITILFLIFDLEIAIIMPIMNDKTKLAMTMNSMLMIILILTVGLIMEWAQGMIEWSK